MFSFQGTSKSSGEVVAIKTFGCADSYIDKFIIREAETMAMAEHENIVKFFVRENINDILGTRSAIIMQYCANGNLQQIVDANPNGLQPEVFFDVAKQLVSAVEYLVKKNITHRDIKPENVMVVTSPRGSTYKLGDFGAARCLEPKGKYDSLHGTTEYIHVDIFIKYYHTLLEIAPKVLEFDITYDFWSLGVTLYELAAGSLPFAPKKGRKDLQTMYKMLSQKQNGQIAASESANGIEWTTELPEISSLAKDKQLTHFLASLINVSYVIKPLQLSIF